MAAESSVITSIWGGMAGSRRCDRFAFIMLVIRIGVRHTAVQKIRSLQKLDVGHCSGPTWNWTMLELRRDLSIATSRQNTSRLARLWSFSTLMATGLTPFSVAFSTCAAHQCRGQMSAEVNAHAAILTLRYSKIISEIVAMVPVKHDLPNACHICPPPPPGLVRA